MSDRERATVRFEKHDARSGDQERGDEAGSQPGIGAEVDRDDLEVDIDEQHNRGEDGGPRARVKPGSTSGVAGVAQIGVALRATRPGIGFDQCRASLTCS